MQEQCPLCGKSRMKGSVFCEDCAKRLNDDFEVKISQDDSFYNYEEKDEVEKYSVAVVGKGDEDSSFEDNDIKDKTKKGKNRFWVKVVWFFVIVIFFVVSYFVYDKNVRQKNLERSGWEAAVKTNTVDGYIAYIMAFPYGTHIEDANENIRLLKESEAGEWQKIKNTGSLSELQGFLKNYTNSPYIPLVKQRLDSLYWAVTLNVNTADSYKEYITLTNSGKLNGEYLSLAENRYEMLYQDSPVNLDVLDSLKNTVEGFYSALSSMNHDGMYNFLAPHVNRFFGSGGLSRERIVGDLLVTAAQVRGARIDFQPNMDELQYVEDSSGGEKNYKVNVALTKSYTVDNKLVQIPGYIVHIYVDDEFDIVSIYETKPYNTAP
ncbi:MAG: hypothetical protein ACOYEA_00635 [Fermentimonas sp.]